VAFDEMLATRIRKAVGDIKGVQEKKMFGGVAFLLKGNMLVGVHKDALIARIAPDDTDAALREKYARAFDVTGRPMRGWILVEPAGIAGPRLQKWIERALTFVRTLPAK
jgi:TfoX/Sxy family transcriptional regulator of competence genes